MKSSELTLDQRIAAWEEALESFRAFAESTDDWSVPSPCPGWSIADLVAHAIDLEAMLAGDPRPAHVPDWSALPHVTHDFGRLTEVGVDFRRGHDRVDMLAELPAVHARALIRVKELGPEASMLWVRGQTPIPQILGLRAFDLWIHEQDARYVTKRPGNYSGAGADIACSTFLSALPRLWVKGAGALAGSALHFTVTGPEVTASVHIAVADDGRAHVIDERPATTTMNVPWISFALLASGREVSHDVRESVTIEGDTILGEKLLASMAVTP